MNLEILVEMQTPATPREGMGPRPWMSAIFPAILVIFITREQIMVSFSRANPRRKEIKAMYMLWIKTKSPIQRI